MKENFCFIPKLCLTSFLVLALLCTIPLSGSAQVSEQLSNAELYRLIAQLEQAGKYGDAAEAYRIIAERDLSEIENMDRAIRNYLEAQKLFARAGDSMRMYQTMTDLGRLYSGSEYYLEAIAMFEKVQSYAERNQDTLISARMLQQIGEIYIVRKQISEASKYFERASELNLSTQDTLLATINQLTITALSGHKQLFKDLPDSLNLELSRFDSIR